MSSKIKLQTSPISAASSIRFRRQSHVQAKWSMIKNRFKTLCFCMFLNIRSCQPKQTRDMQRIQKSSKAISKTMILLSKLSQVFINCCIHCQVQNLDVLVNILGSILDSISDHVGIQNDVRTASKNHHEKRCQHKPNMNPNMTPRGLPKRPHESAPWWRRGPSFAS